MVEIFLDSRAVTVLFVLSSTMAVAAQTWTSLERKLRLAQASEIARKNGARDPNVIEAEQQVIKQLTPFGALTSVLFLLCVLHQYRGAEFEENPFPKFACLTALPLAYCVFKVIGVKTSSDAELQRKRASILQNTVEQLLLHTAC